MKPDRRTGLFSEADMRRGGNPWATIAAAMAIGMLTGCTAASKIGILPPETTITPPAALMQPFEQLQPFAWTDAKTAPIDDGSYVASGAATAPKASVATVAAPKSVSPSPAQPPAASKPVPAKAAPTPLIPPAPAAGGSKETGIAPMPKAPPQ